MYAGAALSCTSATPQAALAEPQTGTPEKVGRTAVTARTRIVSESLHTLKVSIKHKTSFLDHKLSIILSIQL
jgi:hypothetical protein